ncbi:peptidyl-prolyl cis-trans isomerase FKBP16-1 [Cucumis melo var. makuwa]|uniref:Peptidyl-prolyl cis-trans isomerase FKBP16-1 n=1 Tax=Cucumis melo var. makuwa TaxID=1194695 RepID=A0A5D3E284_CUCMM|nr:peptidyl-prolyl cis-trans isomerase FKBP16-1 [Cucumis melo var. makuwa]
MDEEVSISKHPMINHLDVRNASFSVKRFPRRLFSHFIGFYPILLYAYPSFGAPMMEMQEPDIVRTLKLDSGVRIQEVFEGDGAEAHEGDMVEFNYVCRRSNGYFVHSVKSLGLYSPSQELADRISAEEALDHEWFREVPLPKSKEFMPTFPAQHARDRYVD